MLKKLHTIFHWKYSNWAIAFAGGGFFGAAMADKFALSYLFLIVTAVYALGCFLTSQTFAITSVVTPKAANGGHLKTGQ